jgi:predicted RNA-binding protein with PIN domain
MPLHYILDGYNILKQVSRFTDTRLKQGRPDFIAMLADNSRLKKQDVTVIFDGYPDSTDRAVARANFKVIFSRDSSADNKIRHLLEHTLKPERLIVVSDDKEVRFFAKLSKAQTLSVAQFLTWISGQKSKAELACGKSASESKQLSFKQTLEINRELRKIWLGE